MAVEKSELRHLEPAEPDAQIEQLLRERNEARAQRDYQRADSLRQQLASLGVRLVDTRHGTRWQRNHAR